VVRSGRVLVFNSRGLCEIALRQFNRSLDGAMARELLHKALSSSALKFFPFFPLPASIVAIMALTT